MTMKNLISSNRIVSFSMILGYTLLIHHLSNSSLYAPEIKKRPVFQVASSTTTTPSDIYAMASSTPSAAIKTLAFNQAFSLRDTPRKILVPNSTIPDNATFVLLFDNPAAAIISQAKIYDISGAEVADFREETPAGSDPTRLTWDGKDKDGSYVRGGIYIYQVQAEGSLMNGTVVVAR